MKENKCYWGRKVCLILIFILLVCSLPIQSAGEHREYDDEKFQDKLIIPASSLKTIDLEFKEGEELEFIYGMQVKEGLPIDVWFVNDENYYPFVGGGEFKFYIDGSQQQVIFTKNIVSITEYGDYRLILANYNNQTVEIDIIFETRIYKTGSGEDSSEDSFLTDLAFPLLVAVIILAVLLIFLFFRTRRLTQAKPEVTNKAASRKSKGHKTPKKSKPPKREAKPSKNGKSKQKSMSKVTSQKSKSKIAPDSTTFCGNCGKPVDTPFCQNCGHEA